MDIYGATMDKKGRHVGSRISKLISRVKTLMQLLRAKFLMSIQKSVRSRMNRRLVDWISTILTKDFEDQY